MTEPARSVRGETVLDKASLALFTVGVFFAGFSVALVVTAGNSPLLVLPSIVAAWMGGKNLLTRRVPHDLVPTWEELQ